MSKKSLSQGYILSEDQERVVIATGFKRASKNAKTGGMIQVYILVKKVNPLLAAHTGLDELICGGCAFRGVALKGKVLKRICYVQLGKGPHMVWKAYQRGNYPVLTDYSVFNGRMVRWGAYGDPAFIPYEIVKQVSAAAAGWTGYTHQWRNPLFSAYKAFVMASVESTSGFAEAHALGWRTFRVAPEGKATLQANEIMCVNTSRGISCEKCGLCDGTATKAKSIVIEAHGAGKRNVA